jgi:hypothetical protein
MLHGESQRAWIKEGVGVEQHDVAPGCLFESEIVGAAESKIDVAAKEPDGNFGVGEFALHHLCGTVSRGVVDDEDLGGDAGGKSSALIRERLETLAKQVARVEGDHDCRDDVIV